jgi:hypothetical protein
MNEPPRPSPPERDPALDAAWRAQSTELPPPSVDAAILAAAHREVASRPRAAGNDDTLAEAREPSRWWWGLAAAATIGAIAFGVVQLAPFGTAHDPTRATDMPSAERTARPAAVPAPDIADETERMKPQNVSAAPAGIARTEAPAREEAQAASASEPAPAAKARPAPAPPPAGARQRAETPALASAERDVPRTPQAPQPFPMAAPPVPGAPPASSPTAKQEEATPAALGSAPVAERAAGLMAKRASSAADSAAPAAAGVSAEGRVAALRTPESFVLRIRELHEAGRLDDAARELVAFRNAYPDADAKLPPALRAWAATIQK